MLGWDGDLEGVDAGLDSPGTHEPHACLCNRGLGTPRIPTSPLIKAAKLMRPVPSAAAPWGRIKARVGRAWGRRAGSAITPVKKTSL